MPAPSHGPDSKALPGPVCPQLAVLAAFTPIIETVSPFRIGSESLCAALEGFRVFIHVNVPLETPGRLGCRYIGLAWHRRHDPGLGVREKRLPARFSCPA